MTRVTLIDFDQWLDSAVPTDFQLLVCYDDEGPWLRLATESAKQGFLRRIGGRYVAECGMDISAWYIMHNGLAAD